MTGGAQAFEVQGCFSDPPSWSMTDVSSHRRGLEVALFSDDGVVMPPLRTMLSGIGLQVVEGTLVPALIFWAMLHLTGLVWALLAGLAWCYLAIARRWLRGATLPAVLVVGALLFTTRTGVALAFHSTFVYLLTPTINAFVLHKITFPRLSKGRRVARWHAADWVLVAVPVALSNFLWMFTAFLGIARPWNYGVPMRDIFEIAAALYLIAQCGVFFILFMAGRNVEGAQLGTLGNFVRRSLAALGSLGRPLATTEPAPRRRVRPPPKPTLAVDGEDESFAMTGSLTGRPSLRLVGQRGPVELKRRRVR